MIMSQPLNIKKIPALTVKNASLSKFTTFQLGGACPLLIRCDTSLQVREVIEYFNDVGVENYVVIGEGSNLLVSDRGVAQYVIRFFTEKPLVEIQGDHIIVDGGTRLDDLAFFYAQNGLSGLGFSAGIPGTVAGAISGNAGAFGHQISESLVSVTILDKEGDEKTICVNDCVFSYRYSRFKDSAEVVLKAAFCFEKSSAKLLLKEREEILIERREKHPDYRKTPCAGSFFKNVDPAAPGEKRQAAGWFLEQAGAKAMTIGGAGVFDKHANIIIKKTSQCTASDVYQLSQKMQKAVLEKFGIELLPEVRFLGDF